MAATFTYKYTITRKSISLHFTVKVMNVNPRLGGVHREERFRKLNCFSLEKGLKRNAILISKIDNVDAE